MASWIFVPVGLRLEATLAWSVDDTVAREVRFSAMEQEGDDPVTVGWLDWEGHYEVAAARAARRLRLEPDRLRRMAACVPAFDRLAAAMAARVVIAYTSSGQRRPTLEARWDIMTTDHPHRPDQLVWSELSLADGDPDTRVYLRHLDGETRFNPPYLRIPTREPHDRPAYLRVSHLAASVEPWAALREALPAEFGPREAELLPAGVEIRGSKP